MELGLKQKAVVHPHYLTLLFTWTRGFVPGHNLGRVMYVHRQICVVTRQAPVWPDFVHYFQSHEIGKVENLRVQCWDWFTYDHEDFIGSVSFPISQLRLGIDGFFHLENSFEKAVIHVTCSSEASSEEMCVAIATCTHQCQTTY
jgi:hypothetical protein